MTETRHPQGIETLILNHKGDRSYDKMARDCGGIPTAKRLHQMVSRPIRNFPDPDTIKGLARGLQVPASEVVAAIARTLGIDMGEEPTALVLPGAKTLPQSSQDLLMNMSTEMQELQHLTMSDATT